MNNIPQNEPADQTPDSDILIEFDANGMVTPESLAKHEEALRIENATREKSQSLIQASNEQNGESLNTRDEPVTIDVKRINGGTQIEMHIRFDDGEHCYIEIPEAEWASVQESLSMNAKDKWSEPQYDGQEEDFVLKVSYTDGQRALPEDLRTYAHEFTYDKKRN